MRIKIIPIFVRLAKIYIFFGVLKNFSNWFVCATRWKRLKTAVLINVEFYFVHKSGPPLPSTTGETKAGRGRGAFGAPTRSWETKEYRSPGSETLPAGTIPKPTGRGQHPQDLPSPGVPIRVLCMLGYMLGSCLLYTSDAADDPRVV